MDKTEYQMKLNELTDCVQAHQYEAALKIVEEIDWKRVKSIRTLSMVADIYEVNRDYRNCKRILLLAYEKTSIGKNILFRLTEISLKLGEIQDAEKYYEQYLQVAPSDNARFILQYKLLKAKGASNEEKIRVLETYKEYEYTERWAYELADLYHKAGMDKECVDACDDMILWFSEGRYVLKAMELKKQHEGLAPYQQRLYEKAVTEKPETEKPNIVLPVATKASAMATFAAAEQVDSKIVLQKMNEAGAAITKDVVVENRGQAMPLTDAAMDRYSVTSKEFIGKTANLSLELEKSIKNVFANQSKEIEPIQAEPLVMETEPEKEQMPAENFSLETLLSETADTLSKEISEVSASVKEEASGEEEAAPSEEETPVAEEISLVGEEIPAAEELIIEDIIPAEEETPVIEEEAPAEEEVPAIEEETPVEEEVPAIEEEVPVVEEEVPVIEEEAPVAEEEIPVIEEEAPVEEEVPVIEEETPVAEEEIPVIEEETPAAEELIIEDIIPAEEETPVIEEEAPAAEELSIEDIFQTEEETPAVEEMLDEEVPAAPVVSNERAAMYNLELEIPDPEPTEEEKKSHTIPLSKVGQNTVPISIEDVLRQETPEERRIRILNDAKPTRMNDEQRKIFTYFARVPGMDHQILSALSGVYKYAGEHTSKRGNIAVMGARGTGKTRLTQGLLANMCKDMGLEAAKIARVKGYVLNKRDMAEVVKEMSGGFLIIEDAGDMNEETIANLNRAMEFRTDCMVVIMEAPKAEMRALLKEHTEFAEKFNTVINIPAFTNDELVTFARTYCAENNCQMDELGVLALYTLISNNQSEEEPVTIADVKRMVDNAIASAKSGGKRFGRGRRNKGKSKMTILYEKDFDLV